MRGRGAKWTDEELIKLEEAVEIFGTKDWKRVSEYIGTRNYISWRHQWIYVILPKKTVTPWTAEEDLKLKEWVALKGEWSFKSAMKIIPGKTVHDIEKRWREFKRKKNNNEEYFRKVKEEIRGNSKSQTQDDKEN